MPLVMGLLGYSWHGENKSKSSPKTDSSIKTKFTDYAISNQMLKYLLNLLSKSGWYITLDL